MVVLGTANHRIVFLVRVTAALAGINVVSPEISRASNNDGNHRSRSMLSKCHSKSTAQLNEKIPIHANVIKTAAKNISVKESGIEQCSLKRRHI